MRVAIVAFLVSLSCVPQVPAISVWRGACDKACSRVRSLGCREALPTAGGATCEQICETVQESGIVVWNLGCFESAPDCQTVAACNASR